MKRLALLAFAFISLSASAQITHGTTTEEIIKITKAQTVLTDKNIGLCDMAMVTRGEDNLVAHAIKVDFPGKRYLLKTKDQFHPDECDEFKDSLEQHQPLPIEVQFTEKLVTNKGSYMGMRYCQKDHMLWVETTVNEIHYFAVSTISKETCHK